MMEDSKILLKKSIMNSIRLSLKARKSGMNTDSLTTWLPIWSSQKEAMFGPAKTMMEMCKAIAWLKVHLF